MGNQISGANRETALQATLPVRKVCDQILEYMLKEINIRDFYLLATKKECSRYVLFLANQLNKTFRSLSFAPARGAAGVLFFQPIDILQKPTKEQEAERQSLCVFLAYFYVRIFQIYGSLALTLIDDANVYVKFKGSDGLVEGQRITTDEVKPYGIVGAPNPLPNRFGWLRGEPLEREGPIYPYRPGRDPLFKLPSDRDFYRTRRRDRGYDRGYDRDRGYGRGRYDRDRSYDDLDRFRGGDNQLIGGATLPESELGRFKFLKGKLDSESVKARIVDNLDIKKSIGHRFLINFDGTFKLKSDEFKADKSRVNEGSLFIQTPSSKARTRFYEIRLEVTEKTLRVLGVRYSSLLDEALATQRLRYGATRAGRDDLDSYRVRDIMRRAFGSEDVEIIKSGADEYKFDTQMGLQSVLEFLKSLKGQFDVALGFRRDTDRFGYTGRDGKVGEVVDTNLKLTEALTYLQEKRPLAHCVARGLQLLGNKNPDGTFTSAACETKFLISKKDFDDKVSNRTDVPEPGGKVLTGGIKALSNLFYDTLIFKSHKLIRSNRAINEYILFMQKLAEIFLDPTDAKTTEIKETLKEVAAAPTEERAKQINHPEFLKLENITDTQMAALCSGLKIEKLHPKSPEGRGVLMIVGKLFGRQIQHAANCGNVLKQLFTTVNLNGIVSVRINKNVFIKGVSELNRINDLTRRVLIDYYSDCEGLYKIGVKVIKEGLDKKAAVAELERQALERLANPTAEPPTGGPPPTASTTAPTAPPITPPTTATIGGYTRKRERTFNVF